jgi:DNA-binding FadR family transcriptional regulator
MTRIVDRVTQVAQKLEKAILAGKLAPGARLPSEREISTKLGVSRSVVREALGRLASVGLVRIQHGSGTRVVIPDGTQMAVGYKQILRRTDLRLDQLSQVRTPLETTIAALAAQNRTEEQLARMVETQKVLANPNRSLNTHVRADMEFHTLLAKASGNPLFSIVLTPLQELLIESRRRTLARYGAALAHELHATILASVAARDAAGAFAAMQEHMRRNLEHVKGVK